MEDTYRSRICPICLGVVTCDLQATPTQADGSFRTVFTAECSKCGLSVAGNKSKLFSLFLDSRPSNIVQEAFFDNDDKWVYQTATYRGVQTY